jgi:hypothetical protein
MDDSHEVEAIMEVDGTILAVPNPGDAWPLVCADEVIKERRCRANEATCFSRAVARSVWEIQKVSMEVIVGHPGSAAIGCIGA